MKLCHAILVGCALSLFAVAALPSASCGQTTSSDQNTPQSSDAPCANASEELKPGIVIEKVTKDSGAERAGLQEGDVLLSWSRGDAKEEFSSPFDVYSVQRQQAIYGLVLLKGLRGTERRVWLLGWDAWDFETRPHFSQNLLTTYLKGEELSTTGKLRQANEFWLSCTRQTQERSPLWLSSWFLFRSARQLAEAREWTEANSTFEEAIRQATQNGPLVTTEMLREWASMFSQQSDLANAEKYYQQALAESRKLGEENLFTSANLESLGLLAWQSLRMTKAEGYFRQALALNQKVAPESLAVASSLNRLSFLTFYLGDLERTEEYSRQALGIQRRLAPGSIAASHSLSYLGIVAHERGLLTQAEDYYRQALVIQTDNNARLFAATTFEDLGLIARRRGDFERAEADYRKALMIGLELSPDSTLTAMALNSLGELANKRGKKTEAEGYYLRALVRLRKQPTESFSLPDTLVNLGEMAEDRGGWTKAEAYYREALKIRETRSSTTTEFAGTLRHIGKVARHKGNLAKAEEYYRRALTIREKEASGSADYAQSLADLAELMREKHEPDNATKLYEQALNAVESQIVHLGGSEESRSGFRGECANYYKDYIDLLAGQKKPAQAFYIVERLRARSLLETLSFARVDIRKGVDPARVAKERALEESINAKTERRLRLIDAEQVMMFDKEISELLAEYKDVEEQIRESSPAYAALTQPQPLTAKEVQQQLLDANTLLLEYSLGDKRSYVFAVSPDSLNAYPLPGRTIIEKTAHRVYELLTEHDHRIKGESQEQKKLRQARAEAESAPAVATLSRMVLEPVAGQLANKRLLIVNDGALQYIPFAILPVRRATGSERIVPLVAEHEIVNLPSASVLAVLRREEQEREPATKLVAVLADPVFVPKDERVTVASGNGAATGDKPDGAHLLDAPHIDSPHDPAALTDLSEESDLDRSAKQMGVSAFPRLPFTRREAEAIDSIAGQNNVLEALDFDASKATALSEQLKDYRIVHFATHGLLNNEHPELSGLVFSLVDKQGNSQDGFLRMLDVYNMDLNADLVVLSACQTALGKEIGEEGIMGLTRGFMYAGAPRVVASLWKVDDEATAELMKRFYEGVLRDHQTPAQALRGAQQWMRTQKAWQAPYYWAGFVLQGEWK